MLPRFQDMRTKRFTTDTSGSLSVFSLLTFPALVIFAGVAMDFSILNAQRKYTQSVADLAALSALRNLSSPEAAREAARETLARNATYDIDPLEDADIVLGSIGADMTFTPAEDQYSLDGVTAVGVQLTTPADFPVIRAFTNLGDPVVQRSAVAEADPRVSFTLSNCLLSLNLFGEMLDPVLDADLSVLCHGEGLRVDAINLLNVLGVEALGLTPGDATLGEVLDAEIEYADVLSAVLGEVVTGPLGTIRLGDILAVEDTLQVVKVGAPIPPIEVQAADIVFGGVELLNENLLDVEIDLDLGGFLGADVGLTVLEPRKVVIGARPGDPDAVAQTSQIRLDVEDLGINGIFELSLGVGVANASATLAEARCDTGPADLAARFNPVHASLVDISLSLDLLGLPLGVPAPDERTASIISSETRTISFTNQMVADNDAVTFGPGLPGTLEDLVDELRETTGGVLGLLHSDLEDEEPCNGLITCILFGLGATLDSLLSTVGEVVGEIEDEIGLETGILEAVFEDLLDLGVAEARLEVLSVTCTQRLAL